MNGKIAAVFLSCLLFACAPAQPPGGSQQASQATAAVPPPSAPAPGPQIITIKRLTCARLLGAAQDDRAAGSMFYLGYEASRLGKRTIDVNEVEGMETAALDYCAEHPDRPVTAAFSGVFGSRR
jgi:hypothetical protein